MRKRAIKYGSLVIGLLAAAVIIASQSFSFHFPAAKAATVQTAAGDNSTDKTSGDNLTAFTISATSFPASAQVIFVHEASCLFELIYNTDVATHGADTLDDFPVSKLFAVIFRVLISPNAP